jgi:hypothetical protein
MSISKLADCHRGLDEGCVPADEGRTQLLLRALRELVERLEAASSEDPPHDGEVDAGAEHDPGGDALGASEPPSDALERWDGGGYFYLETAVPGLTGVEIDVTMQEERAFIRMSRF